MRRDGFTDLGEKDRDQLKIFLRGRCDEGGTSPTVREGSVLDTQGMGKKILFGLEAGLRPASIDL